MSIDIRYLTNGEKSTIVVVNSGVTPVTIDFYETPEDVPYSIRHYCPAKAVLVGPDSARMFGAMDVLYPGFPECRHPSYNGTPCIAEHCKFAYPSYTDCPYFDTEYRRSVE